MWRMRVGRGGRAVREGERERELEESEGCSSVSGLWSLASWDSWILCQDPTLQNQSLSTGHKEKDTHMCILTLATKRTFTQHLTGDVFSPCLASTRQPQHVRAVCDCRLLWCDDYRGRGEHVRAPTFPKLKKTHQHTNGLYYPFHEPMKCREHLVAWWFPINDACTPGGVSAVGMGHVERLWSKGLSFGGRLLPMQEVVLRV